MGWALVLVALLVLAALAGWRWIAAHEPVALLDRVDRLLSPGRDALVARRVAYGEAPGQVLHLHRAERAPAAQPVLIFIHGGSWTAGDPVDYAFVGRNFAPEGFVVVVAGYRLGAAGRFPAMLQDGAAAIRWVHDNIAAHGGDPERIYLMGHSAGAYNAVMLALDRQWLEREGLPDGTIDGVVALAGPYDFFPFRRDSTRAAFGHAARPEATQPVNFARADAPPLLLIAGAADATVKPRNTRALAAAMRAAGGHVEAAIFPGLDHAGVLTRLARPFYRDGRVKETILSFLSAREADLGRASLPVQGQSR